MKVTVFKKSGDGVVADQLNPERQQLDEFNNLTLKGVSAVEFHEVPGAVMELVEIKAGGNFPMHAGGGDSFFQIVRGRGKVALPDGREIGYEAPEVYVFEAGTDHEWRDVEEDTLFAICSVRSKSD